MTQEQIIAKIAAHGESLKSAHKRIDKVDKLTEAVHELARSNTAIATEVKVLACKFDKTIERIEQGQRSQDKRIGALEKEPGDKWKKLISQIITILIAMGVGWLLSQILGISGYYNLYL